MITRGPMIVRDIDVLSDLARRADLHITFSIPTVDDDIWRKTEPGTAHPRQRLHMRPRLHPTPQNPQHSCIRRSQPIDSNRRHSRCSHLSDQPPIHNRQRLSRIRPKKLNHRHVRMLLERDVPRIERHHLRSHHSAIHGRHHRKPSATRSDRHHRPHRLNHPAGRKIHKRLPDGGN